MIKFLKIVTRRQNVTSVADESNKRAICTQNNYLLYVKELFS